MEPSWTSQPWTITVYPNRSFQLKRGSSYTGLNKISLRRVKFFFRTNYLIFLNKLLLKCLCAMQCNHILFIVMAPDWPYLFSPGNWRYVFQKRLSKDSTGLWSRPLESIFFPELLHLLMVVSVTLTHALLISLHHYVCKKTLYLL
jgi:hypothetical protein